MQRLALLLVGLLLVGGLGATTQTPTPQTPTPKSLVLPKTGWIYLHTSQNIVFDIAAPSVNADPQTKSVDFMLRGTFKEVQDGIKMIGEHTLVICSAGLVVTLNQVRFDAKGNAISTSTVPRVTKVTAGAVLVKELYIWVCASDEQRERLQPKI